MCVEGQEPTYCLAEQYHQIITILGKRIKKRIKIDDRCQIYIGTVMDRQKPVNTRGFDTRVAYGYTRGYYVINRGFTGYPGHPWLYLAQMRSP